MEVVVPNLVVVNMAVVVAAVNLTGQARDERGVERKNNN